MTVKRHVLAAVAVPLTMSGCGSELVQDGFAVTRNAALIPFTKSEPEAPQTPEPLAVSWNVLASPVSIAGQNTDQTSRIGGHAVLSTADHAVPERYRVTWSGLRDSAAEEPTRVTLRDADGDRALTLQFEGNRLRVITAKEDVYPKLTFDVEATHHVAVVLNMSPRPTVAIDIREGKIPLYTTPPMAVLDKGFDALEAMEVEVTSEGTSYYLADFQAVATKG